MKKPDELIDLLAELREEITRPTAQYESGAEATIYIGKGEIHLTATEAVFLLHSADTVRRLYDAIGAPDDCGIELREFEIEDEVEAALDAVFSTVDSL